MSNYKEIRKCTSDDLQNLQALLTEVRLPLDGIEAHLPTFLVFDRDNRIEGSVGLEVYGEYALLRSLAVSPNIQGKGWGDRLYQAAIGLARSRGIVEICILTETAARFFEARGFEHVSRDEIHPGVKESVEFTSACPASAACMRLRLVKNED